MFYKQLITMKITQICWIALLLVGCVLGATSCQTAVKKPVSALPAVAATPAITDKTSSSSKPGLVLAPQTNAKGQPKADSTENPNAAPAIGAKGDAVDAIVAQADKEYEAGQENYAAEHPEAAKDNFDRAFSLLEQAPG